MHYHREKQNFCAYYHQNILTGIVHFTVLNRPYEKVFEDYIFTKGANNEVEFKRNLLTQTIAEFFLTNVASVTIKTQTVCVCEKHTFKSITFPLTFAFSIFFLSHFLNTNVVSYGIGDSSMNN